MRSESDLWTGASSQADPGCEKSKSCSRGRSAELDMSNVESDGVSKGEAIAVVEV